MHHPIEALEADPGLLDGRNVVPELANVRKAIQTFSTQIHDCAITGSIGKPFRDVVVVGIGGSNLGTEFVATDLSGGSEPRLRLHTSLSSIFTISDHRKSSRNSEIKVFQ